MTTVTASQTAAAVTAGFVARLSSVVEAAGMFSVAAVMALCINAML